MTVYSCPHNSISPSPPPNERQRRSSPSSTATAGPRAREFSARPPTHFPPTAYWDPGPHPGDTMPLASSPILCRALALTSLLLPASAFAQPIVVGERAALQDPLTGDNL